MSNREERPSPQRRDQSGGSPPGPMPGSAPANSVRAPFPGEFGEVVDGSGGTPLDPKGSGYPGDRKPRIGASSRNIKESPAEASPVAEDPGNGKPIIHDRPIQPAHVVVQVMSHDGRGNPTPFPTRLDERGYGAPSTTNKKDVSSPG